MAQVNNIPLENKQENASNTNLLTIPKKSLLYNNFITKERSIVPRKSDKYLLSDDCNGYNNMVSTKR